MIDQYPAHMSRESNAQEKVLDIYLILVFKGGTAAYQPLDRRVDGALKSKARCPFDQ
jgi:hypothetical protein